MSRKNVSADDIAKFLETKARKSACTYKVSAIAFDKNGDVLGHATNSHADWDVTAGGGAGRVGTAKHAERRLFRRYKDLVKTVVICRVGHGGDVRPIDPCPVCAKVARKYGARIISICPGSRNI